MNSTATARARTLWEAGAQWEDAMATLRAEGFSKIDSIRATVEILRIPLMEAKRLVHFSSAWRDTRTTDDAFHTLVEAVTTSTSDAQASKAIDETLSHQDVAQRLVGVVTALRGSDLDTARGIITELLDQQDPIRVVMLSGVLTAALSDMAQIGPENLVEALGILVALGVESSGPDAADALVRVENALSDR